jgi:hypothetical protein
VIAYPESAQARAFIAIAGALAAQTSIRAESGASEESPAAFHPVG